MIAAIFIVNQSIPARHDGKENAHQNDEAANAGADSERRLKAALLRRAEARCAALLLDHNADDARRDEQRARDSQAECCQHRAGSVLRRDHRTHISSVVAFHKHFFWVFKIVHQERRYKLSLSLFDSPGST